MYLQNAAIATGNGVAMDVTGRTGKVGVQVSIATAPATVTFEASVDGITFYGVGATPAAGGAAVATATASGLFVIDAEPFGYVRARISAWTAVAVTAEADDDVFTATSHGLSNGTMIRFASLAGGAGISAGVTYFVRDVTADTFKVAATAGGAAIDITTDLTSATYTAGVVDVQANDE